jgi:hypothetical protein
MDPIYLPYPKDPEAKDLRIYISVIDDPMNISKFNATMTIPKNYPTVVKSGFWFLGVNYSQGSESDLEIYCDATHDLNYDALCMPLREVNLGHVYWYLQKIMRTKMENPIHYDMFIHKREK